MAICINCGTTLDEGLKFCTNCGKAADAGAGMSGENMPRTAVPARAPLFGKKPLLIALIAAVAAVVSVVTVVALDNSAGVFANNEVVAITYTNLWLDFPSVGYIKNGRLEFYCYNEGIESWQKNSYLTLRLPRDYKGIFSINDAYIGVITKDNKVQIYEYKLYQAQWQLVDETGFTLPNNYKLVYGYYDDETIAVVLNDNNLVFFDLYGEKQNRNIKYSFPKNAKGIWVVNSENIGIIDNNDTVKVGRIEAASDGVPAFRLPKGYKGVFISAAGGGGIIGVVLNNGTVKFYDADGEEDEDKNFLME
jgi:hypothetical protein